MQLGNEGSLRALPLPFDPCGWSRLGSPCALVFFVASIRAAGQCFSWPCRGFPFPAVGSLSIFAIETLLGLHGAELPSWWDSAKRELEIIAKPLGLLHESLLSVRSFLAPCAQKLATTLCPCNTSPAVCHFVLVAACRFL